MGSYSRLFIPIFAVIAVVIGARYSLLIETESADARLRYEERAAQLAANLAATLPELTGRSGQAAAAALLNRAFERNADLAHARWRREDGPDLAAAPPPRQALPDYPDWLAPLAGLQPLHQRLRVPLAGGAAGTLTLWYHPVHPLNRVWRALLQQAKLSLLNVVIIYTLLGLLIFANRRMLRRLDEATTRFQNGEHAVRMAVRGSAEWRAVATTFNSMAAQVQALVRSLHEQKERIEVTLASIGDAVITTGLDGRIDSMNDAAQALTGWHGARACGLPLEQVFTLSNNFGSRTLANAMRDIRAGGPVVRAKNQTLRQREGVSYVIEYTAAAIRRRGGGGGLDPDRAEDAVEGVVLVFRDVSEKRQLIQQMSWQSQHDVLTGLPNRAALAAQLEQELALARDGGGLLAVCLFDLDHFQRVNEQGGHALGDEVLKQAASRLHDFAGPRHYAARLGGDEFVLLLPDLPDRAAVERALERLMLLMADGYRAGPRALSVSASAGVALHAGGDISADSLLRHADQALYQAKLTGRNKVHYFDAELDEQVRTHHNRRTEVRGALRNGELCLYYQPKLDMRAGRIVGMEALLRWNHPRRGVVGPADFLPVVEHSDLIADIGDQVLRQALRQLDAWRGLHADWVVSVNIAARHFQKPDFVARLRTILDEFPEVPPSMLELEILESSALQDIDQVRAIMLECQAIGIRFALDDFGTGYSSLSYLKRLPADTLKIDQSFVRNMLIDRDDLHLVSAVVSLARAFNRGVIAEGVETVEHGAQLLRLGCTLAQGYGIARPMPADQVLDWAAGFAPTPAWRRAAQLAEDGGHAPSPLPARLP
ncbi:putative bifunctional diguanylate cyclase/phosphodiesterase [Pseudoduganella namucuonensis]|nr:GGDEF domain-containing phosphodiesterase [Pseudoduganella namucuonensis]